MSKGVISMGIHCPIIREGDDLSKIVIASVLKTTEINDGDIIGITESVVARAYGNYVTVDEVAKETVRLFGKDAKIYLLNPIYSRNRFSMILKGIARAAKSIVIEMPEYDEVGNPRGVNPWTGVNIQEYYKNICEQEGCECGINEDITSDYQTLNCSLHSDQFFDVPSLLDYFPGKCQWGLLGSNKANEETLKLFPNKDNAEKLVESIQRYIKEKLGVTVQVMIYGDGCFKDPDTGIWEFADPVAAVAYTDGLNGSPNEIKLKAFADDRYKDLSGTELEEALKKEIKDFRVSSIVNSMDSQGTTPRRYVNSLASLMDLTSGSGDKGTPIVVVKNYFKNYAC